MTDALLNQGIAALKAGKKAEARRLLTQAVNQDTHNEIAWLWLSGAVETDEDRRVCLENVLAINPNNDLARRGLESVIAKQGVRPLGALSSPTTEAELRIEPQVRHGRSFTQQHASPEQKGRKLPFVTVALGIAVVCLVVVILIGAWYIVNSGLLAIPGVVPGFGLPNTTPAPSPTPTSLPIEEIIVRTLGSGYIFEQSYLGSPEGSNILVIEARASMNDQVSPLDHIPFFVEVYHAFPGISGIKLVVWGDWPYSFLVRSSDIKLYEQGEIYNFEFVMRWAE